MTACRSRSTTFIFSFNVLTEHNPSQAFYYRHVATAEKTGEREVTFNFDQTGNRELPHIIGQLLVFPKHYWEGTDKDGDPRDISRGTLEIPLGSGPYRIKSVIAGRTIAYERVPDYWGRDLNVNVGSNNLDEIRYEYFPRPDGGTGGLQGRPDRLADGIDGARVGHQLQIRRHQ